MLGEPLTHRFVVSLEDGITDEDGHHHDAYTNEPLLPKLGIGMVVHEGHLQEDELEVGDVERIGKVAEELADARAVAVGRPASGSQQDDERKEKDDAEDLVETVGNAVFTPDAGHTEDGDDEERCPPESAFHADGAARGVILRDASRQDAGNEHTAEEGERQTGESDVNLVGHDGPSALDVVERFGEEARQVPSHRHVQQGNDSQGAEHRQHNLGQMAQEECIEDVGYVLVCE